MHNLGLSSIGCEDFSIPPGITNGVLVSVMKVLCNLGKAKAKQN